MDAGLGNNVIDLSLAADERVDNAALARISQDLKSVFLHGYAYRAKRLIMPAVLSVGRSYST
jgi:hypothetical protein